MCPWHHELKRNCLVCSNFGVRASVSVCEISNTHHTVSFPGAVYLNMRNMSSMYAFIDPSKHSSIVPWAAVGALAYMSLLALNTAPAAH